MSGTILIVDDEEDIARLVALNLEAAGYVCHQAHRGDVVVDMVRELRPDLVLLDRMLPGMDGVEVCRELRRNPRTATTNVIMLTARTLPSDRIAGLEAGADDYIIKPFDVGELLARVETSLRRARQLRATSPLTGLPGNFEIKQRIDQMLSAGEPFALLHIDLDSFKAFNDHYGFLRGDRAIALTARVVEWAVSDNAGDDSFIGHIGGDDFIVVCDPACAEAVAKGIIAEFDERVGALYDLDDRQRGFVEIVDRAGTQRRHPLLTVSIGVATTDVRDFTSATEAAAVAADVKSFAKATPGSAWRIDRRRLSA